jgi:hypothetical protein
MLRRIRILKNKPNIASQANCHPGENKKCDGHTSDLSTAVLEHREYCDVADVIEGDGELLR